MCVIAIKTKIGSVEKTRDAIEKMLKQNPDGARILLFRGNREILDFATMDNLAAIDAFAGLAREDDKVILHARIATSGAKTTESIHLQTLRSGGFKGCKFAHNGVISALTTGADDWDTLNLMRILESTPDRAACERVLRIFAKTTASKFLVVDNSGFCRTFGDWQNADGFVCSNNHWASIYSQFGLDDDWDYYGATAVRRARKMFPTTAAASKAASKTATTATKGVKK